MNGWTLAQVEGMCAGRLTAPEKRGERFTYEQISLDSRTLRPGDFFVALRGETHDAHRFLPDAESSGALAALVDRPLAGARLAQIVVADSLQGWQRWGAEHRRSFSSLTLLGLTGSSGKTTSKDLITHLLEGRAGVHATSGNHNNHVGVPWTLLGLREEHEFAVIEMGMNHPGEIRELSRMSRPTAALITDIGTAHVGHLGSREAILSAKLEIIEGLPPGAPLVLPQDRWVLDRLTEETRSHRILTFGWEADADWHPVDPIEWSLNGTRFRTPKSGRIELSLLGRGAVLSALASLAAVESLGLDAASLALRLATAPRRPLRMQPFLHQGVQWLLDCYNASPESTRLAIGFLREVPHRGRRILVLGELGELGEHSAAIHQDLGRRAGAVETVVFVGEGARSALHSNREAALSSTTAVGVDDAEEAAEWLRPRLRSGDLILLKGARRMKLERILEKLYPDLSPSYGHQGD